MQMETLRAFFMWNTIINGVLLTVTFLLLSVLGDVTYRLHSKLYPISKPAFHTIMYVLVLSYKMLWLVFNLVPWLALLVLG